MAVFSRCRPLLGTYVAISLTGSAGGRRMTRMRASRLVARAFGEIDQVSALMSFHDPKSDLSRLNRAGLGEWVDVDPALCQVLRTALRLQRGSRGYYNVAVGGPLVASRLLPGTRGGWNDLVGISFEVRKGRARRLKPVLLDLGGIAKGYAVDRAVDALKGRASGVVNAGGDLRVFGKGSRSVTIRAGSAQTRPLEIRNRAIATSSIRADERGVSPYIDVRKRRHVTSAKTAVVVASSCMMADALAKVALLAPAAVTKSLARRARARIGLLA